ncbi:MAG: cysteine synthase A [Phycisphaerales bacterium]|jgi:cysteine synthase A
MSSNRAKLSAPPASVPECLCAVDGVAALIGGTPLLEIHYRVDGQPRRIYAKYESMNMTGSVKDRMALHVLRRAYESGALRPGDQIVEASSGNTGISFAAIGRALGHRVRIYMPDWMSAERGQLMHNFGAEVVPVSKAQGGFVGSVRLAREFAEENERVFLPSQFDNESNIEAHELGTGPEIVEQLAQLGQTPDVFVAGVGTGGTVMGVGRCLRRSEKPWAKGVRIHPLEPANSPTMRTGHRTGQHRIQGISDEFIPSIVHFDELDEVVDVWDGDGILMAQMLCYALGLAVGISSGANVIGAMQRLEERGGEGTVVTVLPDSNKKYLSTALCNAEPPRDEYLSPRVRLDRFVAVR